MTTLNSSSPSSLFAQLLAEHEKAQPVVIGDIKFVEGIYLGNGLVDYHGKTDGQIVPTELSELDLTVGQNYRFQVVASHDGEDEFDDSEIVRLSYFRAKAWTDVEALKASGAVVKARVSGLASRPGSTHIAGLKIRIGEGKTGLNAFVPRSEVGVSPAQFEALVGTEIDVKLKEVDANDRKCIASHKAIVEARRDATFASLEVGQTFTGIVCNVVDFGAFIDIGGGVRGLLHNSEIAGGKASALKRGEHVQVSVVKIDRAAGKIGLSAKSAHRDRFFGSLKPEAVLPGRVCRLADYGAFVTIDAASDTSGLLHRSECGGRKLVVGDQITVKVLRVDVKEGRIGLTLLAS